jgi:hypothetical protein
MMVLAMSHGELSRYDTLMRIERGELRVEDAAALLRLKRRQVFRPLERRRSDGNGLGPWDNEREAEFAAYHTRKAALKQEIEGLRTSLGDEPAGQTVRCHAKAAASYNR